MTGRDELIDAGRALTGAHAVLGDAGDTANPSAAYLARQIVRAMRLVAEARDAVTALEDRPWYGWFGDALVRMVGRGE